MSSQPKDFKEYLREQGYRETTIKTTSNEVRHFQNWVKEKTEITEEKIQYKDALRYIEVLQNIGNQPHTINFRLRSLRHYYNFLKTPVNPFQGISVRGEKTRVMTDILTTQELKGLYMSYEPETIFQKRNKVILGLFCFQGITTREIEKIEEEDIDFNGATIKLRGTRKYNPRRLPLDAIQISDLIEYKKAVRMHLKNDFPKAGGHFIVLSTQSGNNIHNSLSKLAETLRKLNAKFNSFQQVRRSVIVNWLKEDNLRLVQYKAGHRYVSSTERYQMANLQELKEVILSSHPLG